MTVTRFKDYIIEASVKDAHAFAKEMHKQQKRSSGVPYISHPVMVAKIVKKYKESHQIDNLVKAALLHDTLEDTDANFEDLEKMFGGLVASLVQELTSDKDQIDKMGKTEYLTNKMLGMTDWALVIKLSDRLHNVSDLWNHKNIKWRDKYKKETENILNALKKDRALTSTQKKIVVAIEKKLAKIPT